MAAAAITHLGRAGHPVRRGGQRPPQRGVLGPDLLDAVECTGQQVHDANVVATMIVHGTETVVAMNVADLARFGDRVRVVPVCP